MSNDTPGMQRSNNVADKRNNSYEEDTNIEDFDNEYRLNSDSPILEEESEEGSRKLCACIDIHSGKMVSQVINTGRWLLMMMLQLGEITIVKSAYVTAIVIYH